MKSLFSLLLFFLAALSAHAQGEPAFLETFRPDARVHDFGTVREADGKVRHTFRLTNKGNAPVAITNVNTSCGCMVATYTKRAVRPGETAAIDVVLDPQGKDGAFAKQVVVLCAAKAGSAAAKKGANYYVRLWVKATVQPRQRPVSETCPYDLGHGLWADQQFLPFPCLGAGASYAYTLRLGNATARAIIVEWSRQPNNRVLRLPAKTTLRPGEVKAIRVSYRYPRRHKYDCHVDLYPLVDGKSGRPVRVKWNGEQKFQMRL